MQSTSTEAHELLGISPELHQHHELCERSNQLDEKSFHSDYSYSVNRIYIYIYLFILFVYLLCVLFAVFPRTRLTLSPDGVLAPFCFVCVLTFTRR